MCKHRVFTTGPPGKFSHTFYFTLLSFFFFFHTYNSYPESDHILPPTTSKSIKGISFHLDSCNSLLTGLPASQLFYSLSSHGSQGNPLKPFISFLWGSKSSVVPISLRVNVKVLTVGCQILHTFVPSFLFDAIQSTCPFPHFMPGTLTFLPFCVCARHATGSGLLHTFTSLSGSVYPQINCFFISFRVGLKVTSYLEDLHRPS